jgi:hypothetical protein
MARSEPILIVRCWNGRYTAPGPSTAKLAPPLKLLRLSSTLSRRYYVDAAVGRRGVDAGTPLPDHVRS